MSVPVSVSSSSPSVGVSGGSKLSVPQAQNGAEGISASEIAGLFANFLLTGGVAGNMATTQASGATAANSQTADFGRTGFSFEPTLFVLPQGLASLSDENLTSLLALMTASGGGEALGADLLKSLTPGTPAAEALKSLLASLKASTGTAAEMNSAALSGQESAVVGSLTVSGADIAANPNSLLVATDLSPTDIEQLKKMMAALTSPSSSSADGHASDSDVAADLSGDKGTTTDPSSTVTSAPVVLVVFLPPQAVREVKNFGLGTAELSGVSSDLTGVGQNGNGLKKGVMRDANGMPVSLATADESVDTLSTSAGKPVVTVPAHLTKAGQKYVSPFDSDGNSAALSQQAQGARSGKVDFAGSIASRSGTSDGKDTVTGEMDKPALSSAGDFMSGWTGAFPGTDTLLDNSAVLSANGTGLSAGATTSALTNPVTSNPSAAGSHPAAQTIAAVIERTIASGSEKAQQTLRVQLDPPELGRVQIQLSYEKGEPMKVHLLAEKKETLSLLERDSHALQSTLEQAGVQMDGSSLSFDLASGDQSFNQMLGQSGQGQDNSSQTSHFTLNADGTIVESSISADDVMQSVMGFKQDSATGNIRYSLLV